MNVSATEFKFTLSRQTVPAGEVVFTVVNTGKISHDFSIAGHTSAIVAPGKTTTLTVRLGNRSYPYLCTLPGHAQAGMKGTLRVGSGQAASAPQKVPSGPHVPAFTAEQLNASPGANWPTIAGDLKNDRYSSLTQITHGERVDAEAGVAHPSRHLPHPRPEVRLVRRQRGRLRAASTTSPPRRATSSRSTRRPERSSGGTRRPSTVASRRTRCRGSRASRSAAASSTSARSTATWSRSTRGRARSSGRSQEIPWQKGGHLASAPLYYNGMVIEGTSGGDQGSISNDMEAFDATNGHRLWAWSIVPAPGQPGSNTWTAADTHYGGGAMWETPAIDPKLNLVIFGTGNPVPWNSRGPGANLYGDSIVALNVYTGQLVWAYQTVHHDLWDSDLPNPPVLFDGTFKVNGKIVTRPALAEITKLGWTWILDRETGKPLEPVKEVKVPSEQGARGELVADAADPAGAERDRRPEDAGRERRLCVNGHQTQTNAYEPFATAMAPDGKRYKMGCHFDPYDTTRYTAFPFEEEDWPATSYNPQAGLFITCGVTARAFAFKQIPKASQVAGAARRRRRRRPDHPGHLDLEPRQLLGAEHADEQARVAPEVGHALLQRHREYRLRAHLRRPHRAGQRPHRPWLPRGRRHEDRGLALALAADGRARDRTAGDLLGQRPPVRLDPRRRPGPRRPDEAARPHLTRPAARRQHLHLRATRHARRASRWRGGGPKPTPGPRRRRPRSRKRPTRRRQATAKGHTTVHVGMVEYRFKLTQSTVPAGKVTFVITNNGKLVHNFDIIGVHVGKLLAPGKSETWTVNLAPGNTPTCAMFRSTPATAWSGRSPSSPEPDVRHDETAQRRWPESPPSRSRSRSPSPAPPAPAGRRTATSRPQQSGAHDHAARPRSARALAEGALAQTRQDEL